MGLGESVLARWNNNWRDISSSNRREGYEMVKTKGDRTKRVLVGFSFFGHGAGAWTTMIN